MTTAPFRYKRSKRVQPVPGIGDVRPEATVVQEYTGQIDGLKASQGEENLLRAAYKSGAIMSHSFRLPVGAPRNLPGWKELDFLFVTKSGQCVAVQVRDYDFVHKGAEAEGKDLFSDMYIVEELAKIGIFLRGNKIDTVSDDDLGTPEDAKKIVETILI